MSEKINFKELLKTEFDIKSKSHTNTNSILNIVKNELQNENSSRDEVMYKVLKTLQENQIEINGNQTANQIKKAMSNLICWARNPKKEYNSESWQLIENQNELRILIN